MRPITIYRLVTRSLDCVEEALAPLSALSSLKANYTLYRFGLAFGGLRK